jgi:choline transport protein
MANNCVISSITNSWMSYTSCFGVTLAAGGPQAVVFAVIVAGFIQWTVTLGLSELASAFPSSGVGFPFHPIRFSAN